MSKKSRRNHPKRSRGNLVPGAGSGKYGNQADLERAHRYLQAVDPGAAEWDPAKLHPSLRGLGPDDEVDVIITTGKGKPEGAGELLGIIGRDVTLDDGTPVPAGARAWQNLHPAPGDHRVMPRDLLPARSGNWKRPDPAGLDLRELTRQLEQVSPGLATRLGEGLGPEELERFAPQIAQAMAAAGARPGTYAFSETDPEHGSKVIVSRGGEGRALPAFTQPVPSGWQEEDSLAASQPGTAVVGGRRDDGGEGLPYGLRPGDLIAVERPAGYYDAGIDLPDSALGGNPPGSRVWRRLPGTAGDDDLDQLSARVRGMLDSGMSSEAVAAALNAPPPAPVRTTWQAEDILGRHARLAGRYRDRDPETVSYLVMLLNAAFGEDPDQAMRMHWPIQAARERDTADARQMAALIGRSLRDALTYQVTAPMVADMRAAGELMPGVLRLNESDLPAPAGFAWLDDPWPIPVPDGMLPVRAVSWETITVPADVFTNASVPRSADAVRLAFWVHLPDTVAYGHFPAGDQRIANLTGALGDTLPHHISVLPFGYRFVLKDAHEAELLAMIALVHSLWTFLGMELSASRTVRPASQAHRKRILRTIRHDRVHVITLRRIAYVSESGTGNHREINRQCKWWVDDFYRHIDPYADEDENGRSRRHEAVPSGQLRSGPEPGTFDVCGVCLARGQTVRITLVRGHRRGPAWLPWKAPSKGRTLHRLSR